jgi:hypothetical protein
MTSNYFKFIPKVKLFASVRQVNPVGRDAALRRPDSAARCFFLPRLPKGGEGWGEEAPNTLTGRSELRQESDGSLLYMFRKAYSEARTAERRPDHRPIRLWHLGVR